VNYRDIAAVVDATRPSRCTTPPGRTLLAHERVNETVMRKHTVIPIELRGPCFKITSDDIVELLRSAYDAFHDVPTRCRTSWSLASRSSEDREGDGARDREPRPRTSAG